MYSAVWTLTTAVALLSTGCTTFNNQAHFQLHLRTLEKRGSSACEEEHARLRYSLPAPDQIIFGGAGSGAARAAFHL